MWGGNLQCSRVWTKSREVRAHTTSSKRTTSIFFPAMLQQHGSLSCNNSVEPHSRCMQVTVICAVVGLKINISMWKKKHFSLLKMKPRPCDKYETCLGCFNTSCPVHAGKTSGQWQGWKYMCRLGSPLSNKSLTNVGWITFKQLIRTLVSENGFWHC